MGADYIPERDHRASVWMKFFAAKLVSDPGAYFATEQEAEAISAAVLSYRQALARAWSNATRTKPNVSRKNEARKVAERLIRPLAQRLLADRRMAGQSLINLGLNPRKKRRKTVGAPASVPWLSMTSVITGELEVTVRDSESKRCARPKDAIGLELYEQIRPKDGNPNVQATGWRFVGMFTTTRFSTQPPIQQSGDRVILVARWINRRGLTGAMGNPMGLQMNKGLGRMNSLNQSERRRVA